MAKKLKIFISISPFGLLGKDLFLGESRIKLSLVAKSEDFFLIVALLVTTDSTATIPMQLLDANTLSTFLLQWPEYMQTSSDCRTSYIKSPVS